MIGDVNRANKRENLPASLRERDPEIEDYLYQRKYAEWLAAENAVASLDTPDS